MVTKVNHTFSLLIIFGLFILAATAGLGQQQPTPSSPVVTASAGDWVRFSAPANITHIRLEVFSSTGEKVFDSGNRDGNLFDWHWQDEKALAGTDSYFCVVTVQSLSGKTSRKLAGVSFANQQALLKPIDVNRLDPAQTNALGVNDADTPLTIIGPEQQPIAATALAHDGNDGQVSRTRGALTFRFGDFFGGKDKEQMRLTEEGNLGIGTSKPEFKLDVMGAIRARQGFIFGDGSTLNVNERGNLTLTGSDGQIVPKVGGTGTQNQLAKWTDNAGTLGDSVLTEIGGKIGVGTTTPAFKLDLVDNTSVAGGFQLTNNTNGPLAQLQNRLANNSGAYAYYGITSSAYTQAPILANRAFFGSFKVDTVIWTQTPNDILFATNGLGADTERMRITAAGNVGINTLVPTERLHVSGNGLFTGNLTVNGTLNATLPANSTNYIQNGTSPQSGSNFNISGNGTLGGTLSANIVRAGGLDTASAGQLSLGQTFATSVRIGGPSTTSTTITSNSVSIGSTSFQSGGLTTGTLRASFLDAAGPSAGPLSIGSINADSVQINKPTTVSGLLTANGGISTSTETISGDLTVGGTINGTVANANNASSLGGIAASQYVQTTDSRMTDARSPTAGSSNYIQNSSSQQPASFNISGSGRVDGGLTVSGERPQLEVKSVFGEATLRVNSSGGSQGIPGITLAQDGVEEWSANVVYPGHFFIFNNVIGANALSINRDSNNVTIGNNLAIGTSADFPTVGSLARLHIVDNGGRILFGNGGCAAGLAGLGFAGSLTCQNYSMLGDGTNTIINRPTGGAIAFRENNADQMLVLPGGAIKINTLGTAGATQLCRNASNHISTCSSSLRYKTNINPFGYGLNLVKRLSPITFTWKDGGMKDLGLGAEDVAKVEPLLVTHNDKGEIEGVKYDRVGVVLINAVKEQQAQIESQQTLIQLQQRQIDALKKLVCAMNAGAEMCKAKE